jgi:hypothetical protein
MFKSWKAAVPFCSKVFFQSTSSELYGSGKTGLVSRNHFSSASFSWTGVSLPPSFLGRHLLFDLDDTRRIRGIWLELLSAFVFVAGCHLVTSGNA